jgi:hypothetical protein
MRAGLVVERGHKGVQTSTTTATLVDTSTALRAAICSARRTSASSSAAVGPFGQPSLG